MEQIFGPVVGIQSVDSFEEATKIINSSKYGLESMVFSKDDKCIDFMAR